ncbi:beta-glucosidase [Apiospora saccharicola]
MLPSIIPGLACLSAFAAAQDVSIAEDAFFYGQSEPVYPTPQMASNGPWAGAVSRAKEMVAQMTLEEKVNLTGGATVENGWLCLADAGNGVRATDYVHSWPSGMHLEQGSHTSESPVYGGEARTKGVNVLLGPCIGPMGRTARGGRNWESFSADPYLDGSLVYETVTGVQAMGVITSTKNKKRIVSHLDLESMPFADAVRAGTGNIMCGENRLNNSYACQNSFAQNGLLKGELGFQGWVVSDWGAQHSGVSSALGGLDVAMPSGGDFWAGNLTQAVNNGSVPEAQLDNMVTRILASWYQMGQDKPEFPEPGVGMPKDLLKPHKVVDARNSSARPTLFDGAAEGHVLVKNTNGALPLDSSKMKLISLYGYSAKSPSRNNPDVAAAGDIFAPWTMGAESANVTQLGIGFFGDLSLTYSAIAVNGTIVSGGGSGATAQNLISSPHDALVAQAYEDGTALFWNFESDNPGVNPTSDACIVVGNVWATEGHDRPNLRDEFTDNLILNVAGQCANTIVVFHNAGIRMVDTFVDHPNVTAIIYAHLPGQDSGKALVSLLYGKTNPSGRLPYTVARDESDYGALLDPSQSTPPEKYKKFPQADFEEGVFIDYRHFDAHNITPRYEFGYGLSYTTFEYADLAIAKTDAPSQAYPVGPIAEGGQTDLWDVVASASAKVSNTGGMDGKEVAQLYIGVPGEGNPIRQLRGFEKPLIKKGETVSVKFELTRRDLSIWDVEAQKWKLQSGEYKVYVGSSSRNLPLTSALVI